MTNKLNDTFIANRALVLATVILTRRGDLEIRETKKDTGLDLHVFIEREDKAMRLVFGILLRGVVAATTPHSATRVLGPTMSQFAGMRKFTYPVCLFFFTMSEEQAYFSWLAEPVVTESNPKLIHHAKAKCVELTNEVLDDAIERIVAWYDAVETVLIA